MELRQARLKPKPPPDINSMRSAIIKPRTRLCLEFRLPKALPRKLEPAKQEAFRRRLLFPCAQGRPLDFLAARKPPSHAAALRLRRMDPWGSAILADAEVSVAKDHIHPPGRPFSAAARLRTSGPSGPASNANGVM
ncbi:MAG: hypothetical protein DLM68_01455 [Hyphomicrobiales bacterium]|nr:MAG: hypothetical protein DLM68_01455 [Hyphomicrobiales bacterium]